jgi:hypothetical protein
MNIGRVAQKRRSALVAFEIERRKNEGAKYKFITT